MKRILTLLLVLGLLFAVGCAKKEAPAPVPAPAPEPTPAPAPEPVGAPKAEGGEILKEKSGEVLGPGVQPTAGVYLSSIKCDSGLISLTITNPKDYDLVYRRLSALDSSKYTIDQISKLVINGRQLNVPEYCNGALVDGVLPAGASADCSVKFTPNDSKSEVLVRVGLNEFGEPVKNQITFRAAESEEIDFVCGTSAPAEAAE